MSLLLAEETITTIVSILVAGVAAYLVTCMKKITKREKAIGNIIKALARKEIMDAGAKYINKKNILTYERHREIVEICTAYIDLGGNGTAKTIIDELVSIKPTIIDNKSKEA